MNGPQPLHIVNICAVPRHLPLVPSAGFYFALVHPHKCFDLI